MRAFIPGLVAAFMAGTAMTAATAVRAQGQEPAKAEPAKPAAAPAAADAAKPAAGKGDAGKPDAAKPDAAKADAEKSAAPPPAGSDQKPVDTAKEGGATEVHEHETPIPPRQPWSFAGTFGKYDTAQLQRGFRVFREVCSNCHSANNLAFRNLGDTGGPHFSEGQVKALAAEYKIKDGPNDAGEMFERPGRPSDYWPAPFPNANAARAANGGGLPPDMSVLAKARDVHNPFPIFIFNAFPFFAYQEGGPDYIASLLQGYSDPPPDVKMADGQYYNKFMPGGKIAMPPPLSGDGQVEYTDGTPATTQQYAKDVAAYLMWMAEPKLDQRKRTGFRVVIFLAVLSVLLYLTKRRVWASVAH